MTQRDLTTDPVWRRDDLGRPIPDSPHAVSMALPCWDHVVGYEEKRPEIVSKLPNGYPRFVVHPLVLELAKQIGGGQPCLPFPSARAADWAAEFVQRISGEAVRVIPRGAISGVVTTDKGMLALKAFWQHTGLIVSSRQAETLLAGRTSPSASPEANRVLRDRLASFYDCSEADVFLAPSGMAAQYAALRILQQRRPNQATLQLGFPYVDTLKLQQKLGKGGVLLHHLDRITEELQQEITRQEFAGCFCEIPGNPLLGSADMRKISPILRKHLIPVVADDVVATPLNVDLGWCADLVATSLTKFIVGSGDAMGGALICNPRSPFYHELKTLAQAGHEELLWPGDAAVFEERARDFPERMRRHNCNGLFIAERLRAHPDIERVWYPKWEFNEAYEAVRRPDGGYGALVTFLPRNAETRSAVIYDRLPVCKGPSLGTSFTLACPFTLLAHYTELDWAEACGVSRYLIRISVGLEDPEELWSRIAPALGCKPD